MTEVMERERARLAQLREEFLGRPGAQDWRAKWWHGMTVDQRRLLCAMAGMDDSEGNCARHWVQLSMGFRESVERHAREWGRLLAPMANVW